MGLEADSCEAIFDYVAGPFSTLLKLTGSVKSKNMAIKPYIHSSRVHKAGRALSALSGATDRVDGRDAQLTARSAAH